MSKAHAERAHSKFSASGAERWFECSASVEASEGKPDKNTQWSLEGTLAHKVLEQIMLMLIAGNLVGFGFFREWKGVDKVMYRHALNAANFILKLAEKLGAEVMVETRIYLSFIHPEMFGTFDGAVLDHFGTLHVFDFKYGAGHAVRPQDNLQMIFYGLGLAAKYKWNFSRVRLWIIQPRIKGYDGPTYWDVDIETLRAYEQLFRDAVKRVETKPEYKEGSWCHWCKAKAACPLKRENKVKNAIDLFKANPLTKGPTNGLKKESQKESDAEDGGRTNSRAKAGGKSEADWRKESKKAYKEKSRRREIDRDVAELERASERDFY